jgi:RND family efflux transporter MFP subunit
MPHWPNLLRWIWVLPLLAVLWGLYSFFSLPVVDVVTSERGSAVEAVYATGNVEPTVMLPVAARSTARLEELKVDEGSIVKEGQLLARLEDEDLRSTLAAARVRAENARQVYKRNTQLLDVSVVSRQEHERSEADLKAAQAEVNRIEAQLGFLTLRAPSAGKIIRRDGEIGELIAANTPIFWLSADRQKRITAEVDEEDIFHVAPGQKVLIRADAFPNEIFEGAVQSITPKGDTTARSYRVRISLQSDTKLMIGMTAETNIVLRQEQNALLIPTSALSENSLWVVEDGRLRRKTVRLGARGAQKSEVLSGISQTDLIVQTPPSELQEGARVSTRQSDSSQ